MPKETKEETSGGSGGLAGYPEGLAQILLALYQGSNPDPSIAQRAPLMLPLPGGEMLRNPGPVFSGGLFGGQNA